MTNERTVSGVAVDNGSIMCVEVHVFFLSSAILFFSFSMA